MAYIYPLKRRNELAAEASRRLERILRAKKPGYPSNDLHVLDGLDAYQQTLEEGETSYSELLSKVPADMWKALDKHRQPPIRIQRDDRVSVFN